MTDTDDYTSHAAQEARRKRLAAELRVATKARLFEALHAAGIASVTVLFDGEGDSGQIVDVSAYASHNKSLPLPAGPLTVETAKWDGSGAEQATVPVKKAIENLCYELLEDKYEGWEINEGAFGEFSFDVAGRTITLTFNERISDVSTSTHTY